MIDMDEIGEAVGMDGAAGGTKLFAETFEELRIWQHARALVRDVYSALAAEEHARRDYGFEDQLRRAAVSSMNNIAEGFERDSTREFVHFLSVAKGSSGEVRSMMYAAEDLHYLGTETALRLRTQARNLSKAIASFSRHLKKQLKSR